MRALRTPWRMVATGDSVAMPAIKKENRDLFPPHLGFSSMENSMIRLASDSMHTVGHYKSWIMGRSDLGTHIGWCGP